MFRIDDAFSGFAVDDIDVARSFYRDTLGMVVEDDEMGFLTLRLPSGAAIFVYAKDDHVPATFTILNFPVTDIDAAVDDLRARGVDTRIYGDQFGGDDRGIVRGGEAGPDIAWFRDPAGNVLAILQT
ncbi:VOC family protein [Microbacterium xanthum]|uniref:VOC family protein n=1 Tax=Microbacterium xanthum TaxID=3079794 RepID=UPI002AD45A44|nr:MULTISPECIES: VOC family protein [unclassified Microbacterium]MDZ8172968.1 VOC family protein [Microbacterium sp. KSW-48]MDZ8200872.1 VOC family protein [Microbacterium sp. SSW1-59]